MRSRFVKAEEMDFVTGLDEVIADDYDEPPPKNIWEKFWQWIVSAPTPLLRSRWPYLFAFTVIDGPQTQDVRQWPPFLGSVSEPALRNLRPYFVQNGDRAYVTSRSVGRGFVHDETARTPSQRPAPVRADRPDRHMITITTR